MEHPTQHVYDALNRVQSLKQPGDVLTSYVYDVHDAVTKVTDPLNLATSSPRNAHGDVSYVNSPDSGRTDFTYNRDSTVATQTDARGIKATYGYDAAGRLTTIDHQTDAVVDVRYTYDYSDLADPKPAYGKGRLTAIDDESGRVEFLYNPRGTLAKRTHLVLGHTFTTEYTYDEADRPATIKYPSGRLVTYVRDVASGLVGSVTMTYAGITTTLASSITHLPFGPLSGYTAGGSGMAVALGHDAEYRPERFTAGSVYDRTTYWEPRDNVTDIMDALDPVATQEFDYDALSRLTRASGEYGTLQYGAYDGVGNRSSETSGSLTDNYQYPNPARTSHRLQSITGAHPLTLQHDAAGNVTGRGADTLVYGNAGRLSQYQRGGSTILSNTYDARGQRIVKIGSGQTTVFQYHQDGKLLGEYDAAGTFKREYVWLENRLLAMPAVLGAYAVIDNVGAGFTATGAWAASTAVAAYEGSNYLVYAATGQPQTSVIVDNGQASVVGSTWELITGDSGAQGGDYLRIAPGTGANKVTWTLTVPTAGVYDVYARWSGLPTNTTAAQYTIKYAGGTAVRNVNQRLADDKWFVFVGSFSFNAGDTTISVSDKASGGNVVADAVRLIPRDANAGYATWRPAKPGKYKVSMRVPASANQAFRSRWEVYSDNGEGDTLMQMYAIDQTTLGGTWRQIGTTEFDFTDVSTHKVMLYTDADYQVAADAVKFEPVTETLNVQSDHLGTPQLLTDSLGKVKWRAAYEPFGEAAVAGVVEMPVRFPGQYHDAETGIYQNWHRDYDPALGRYLESDPIGLGGGLNTYSYVMSNPLGFVDPLGLDKLILFDPTPFWTSDSQLLYSARHYPDSPDKCLVFGHGNPRVVRDDRGELRRRLTPDELAELIRKECSPRSQKHVELLSCETAKGERSFAERLSEALDTKVTGYPEQIIIGPKSPEPNNPRTFGGD